MTTIAVSILNYNNAEATFRCVNSLLSTKPTSTSLSIWITDNASTDADRRNLFEKLHGIPQVQLYQSQYNRGFSAGHNCNLRSIFREINPEFVWLLNNDCDVLPGAISSLLHSARSNQEVGIWGVTLLEPDGKTIQCAGGCSYYTWISSYRQFGSGKPLAKVNSLKQCPFDYIAGASIFMPVGTLIDGLATAPHHPERCPDPGREWLNETFFLYFEELDLARRLKPNLRLGWCREAWIKHGQLNAATETSGKRTAKSEFHSTLGALKFTWLYERKKLWIVAPVRFLTKSLLNLLHFRPDLFIPNMKAYRDFCTWVTRGTQPARKI